MIQVGKGKVITMTREEIGREIIEAIIKDIGSTQGHTKKVRYHIDLEISVDEATDETKIASIILRHHQEDSAQKITQEEQAEITAFQEELDKL